jgi:ribosomal protein S18 acetylase RimI-like enzyme
VLGELMMRVATGADAPVLAALHRSVHAQHVQSEPDVYRAVDTELVRAWFVGELGTPDTRAELAFVGELAVGYSLVQLRAVPETIFTRARRVLLVHQIGVDPDRRRHGVGRALMTGVREHAVRCGAQDVELQVRAGNADAIAFYEALGYRRSSLRLVIGVDP